jgi:catechol 2,3-dioxygenase-like lactoylglutathione lyase family enzyme
MMDIQPRFAQFGPVMQLAFVPKDINAALHFWTQTMGVGPFFKFPHVAYEHFAYEGQKRDVDFSVLTAYWGEMQIELIEQHNAAPSTYTKWQAAGHDGLHHVCIAVESVDGVRAHAARTGARIAQEMRMGGLETIYVDSDDGPAPYIEFAQMPPQFVGLFDMMRGAARGWDGTDPVRRIGGA